MLGPDIVSASSRVPVVQMDARPLWVQTPVAQQLGLRDGQIIQAVAEVRDQRVRLWLKDFFFELPNGWVLKDGETMPKMLDHIDCNKINNTPINLRAATNQENQRNRLINKNSKSRHKNIHLAKCGNFRVEIRIDLYIRYRKTHKTVALAVEDRDRVLLKHFGAFSNNGVVS